MSPHRAKIHRQILLSLLSSLAVIIFIVESALPNPFPWLRLGLSNIIVMVVIVLYGFKEALAVSFLKTMVGSIIIGTFLGPTFWLSLGGGLASVMMMGFVYRFFSSIFSLIGVSIAGAYTHSLTQMFLVFTFLIHQREIFYLMPIILFGSLITGFLNGLAAIFLLEYMPKSNPSASTCHPEQMPFHQQF